ncbi:MAG: Mu-like prophage major head subunit gpT family protein [Gemmataceae bacterium]|nr:Mu-like prophage major head subunit gpT family protein [Gemmataceae bacterium]
MPRDAPKPFTAAGGAAVITAADTGPDGKPKQRRFSGVAYTGAVMQPGGWLGRIICALDGLRFPDSKKVPALRQHDHQQIAGHTDTVEVTPKGLEVGGPFSGQAEHAAKVTEPADGGFPWQMSIGAEPVRTEFLEAGRTATVNGQEVTGPLTISWETEIKEVSFVPVGADGHTSAVVANPGSRAVFKSMLKAAKLAGHVRAAKYSDDEIDKMSHEEAKAALKYCMAHDEDDKKAEAHHEDDKKAEAHHEDDKKAEAHDEDDKKAEAHHEDDKKAEAAGRRRLEASRKAEADELDRCDAIKALARQYGIDRVKVGGADVPFVATAIRAGWSADKAKAVVMEAKLDQVRAERPGAGVGGPHVHIPGAPVLNEAVIECAALDALGSQFRLFDSDFYKFGDDGKRRVPVRDERRITAELNARYTDQVRQAAHTHFRGRLGLQQMLTTLAAANGYRGPQTFNDPGGWGEVAAYLSGHIRADGPSQVNTPQTLANVQNKLLLQGYLFTEQSYLDVCGVVPVKDLKPTKSVQLFGDFQFRPLAPSGEIQHATVGDNAFANQAAIQARMITLDLQYIINDDLNAFGQLPMMLGRGWGLRVNDLVWTKLLAPGTDDGGSTNFFAATHTITGQSGSSNYNSGAGSALNSAGLQAAKQLFDRQVDPAGKPLGVDAEILLYPPELDVAATELMNAQFIVMAGLASTAAASKQPNTNIWKGRFKPVMSRYLSNGAYTGYSTTGWYLLANPAVLPVIQIAALNGQMTPTIQTAGQDWQFNMLGISMRGWGGVGVSMQNFRGGVLSAGA